MIVSRVIQRAAHQLRDVLVGEAVEDVFAVAAPRHEALGAEDLQPLRDGGEPVARLVREVRDAVLAAEQAVQDPQSPGISGRAKDRRRALEHVRRERFVRDTRVIVVMTAAGRLVVHQLNE